MNNNISGLGGANAPPLEARTAPKQAEAEAAAPARREGDRVNLTESARSIQQSEQAQSAAPAVNAERVAAIRQDLAAGRLSISPERIADGLLAIERQLAGSS
ncbi:MAG: flagellar biosynthesis anti-sigma factor FlgM [Gammaproteobacteria bacterium HGW-Gammaproteobacteria-2]|jgi:negative regulator of flagellin synthesis FlgM|nr:MAG: flagellar biosynthesis anti-sigma factor FlgM [Gammaproteobacteria bacterium HGW-Gammaproteobacteria-2]